MPNRYIPVKNNYARHTFDRETNRRDANTMNNIARIRKARGLRQSDLADMVGITQPHISRIEGGDEGPPLSLFRQISDALGVSLATLFSDRRHESEQILIDTFRSLPPHRRAGWIEMARLAKAEAQSEAADPEADRTPDRADQQ